MERLCYPGNQTESHKKLFPFVKLVEKQGGVPINFNPFALRMAKPLWSFGHSECKRVNGVLAILSAKGLMGKKLFLRPIWSFGHSECKRVNGVLAILSAKGLMGKKLFLRWEGNIMLLKLPSL